MTNVRSIWCLLGWLAVVGTIGPGSGTVVRAEADARWPAVLPGTQRLELERPLDEAMVDGIRRFALRELADSPNRRGSRWHRDFSSPEAYAKSVEPNRERLRTIIGTVDPRESDALHVFAPAAEMQTGEVHFLAEGPGYRIYRVRWRVLEGVTGEGLLLRPKAGPSRAFVVALPDADWTPEMFCGLAPGVAPQAQLGRRLAEHGCTVLVPTLISRDDTFSGHPQVRYTNQPHREFVYRMAFEMGRHIIGYEVQKVLAAVDAVERGASDATKPLIGVAGVGEGALLALYSAAVDTRIDAALVCGYFQPREALWQEPIYRNVWSLLTEFGDAELAGLIAPRPLVIEACAVPEVAGPPQPRDGRRGAAPGRIEIATVGLVREEFDRAQTFYQKLGQVERISLVVSGQGDSPAGSSAALAAFLKGLHIDTAPQPPGEQPRAASEELPDPKQRQYRQLWELVEFTQRLLRRSDKVRDRFWAKADRSSVENWVRTAQWYRDYVYEEMIGKLPPPTMPPNPRTRQILDDPDFVGYEVVLDVYPDVIAGGILLIPKDLRQGERRPVVVCQHGLEGTPMHTITEDRTARAWRAYKGFSAQLARRGFVVYAPQNPYRGQDRFRVLQRMSNPMKRSLFSYILRQHERTLDWLVTLDFVDPERIGFYGLSYGGKTAVRVPPLLPRYALSICSADFNEWIRKNVSSEDRYSYIFTGEYEMFEWNMGHVANYAELASLMTPRPFMVERGHDDGVAPDEWVAWEYAKVRRHYDKLGIGDRTEIEFFDGPHTINGQGTFRFLHRHLKWPEPQTTGSSR